MIRPLAIFCLVSFCLDIRAAAPVLTPEMERLNASDYFKTSFNQFDGILLNQLSRNKISRDDDDPSIYLNASRRVDSQSVQLTFRVALYTHKPSNRFPLSETQAVYMVIDGAKVSLLTPSEVEFGRGENLYAADYLDYDVPEEFLRALAGAKRAQFKIDSTDNRTLARDLNATNIARFKVFCEAFIDGGLARGLATKPNMAAWTARTNKIWKTRMTVRGRVKETLTDGLLVWSGEQDMEEARAFIRRVDPGGRGGYYPSIQPDGSITYIGPCFLAAYPTNATRDQTIQTFAFPNGTITIGSYEYPVFTCRPELVTRSPDEATWKTLTRDVPWDDFPYKIFSSAQLPAGCFGADPCRTCVNCRQCAHCRDGRACGSCKKGK